MADEVNVTIDGSPVSVPKGTLLWEAAKRANVDVPIFCYHSKLGPVGVCRMCMVEVEGMPKLTTACTTAAADGMVVYTKSPEVEKAQRGVLEFLLINHPLDCPICDRGGECPLQDQTFAYGPGVSRFIEPKRHYVKPVPLGPTIALDRERCILCWRCVRFTSEVAEDDQLILFDRGSETYIATYEGLPYVSNYSGNVIELCPVGALTSSKQRFTFRPWELQQHASICPHCPMGCNIHIDVRDAQEVIRFRSRTNDAVDDGWLCDRGRFGYDFIGSPDRLKTPLIRREGKLVPTSWPAAYRVIAENLQRIAAERGPQSIAGIASPRLSNEDLYAFRRFLEEVVGSGVVDYWPRPDLRLSPDAYESFRRLDSHLTSLDSVDHASVIVIVGADPSEREPVMELRVRKAINRLGAKLLDVGTHDIALTPKASAVIRWTPTELAGVLTWLTRSGQLPDGVEAAEYEEARSLLSGDGRIVVLYDDSFPDIAVPEKSEALIALARFVESLALTHPIGVIPMMVTSNEMAARDFGLVAKNADGSPWGTPVVERLIGGEFAAAFIAGANPAGSEPSFADAVEKLDFCVVTELQMSETASVADVVLPAACFAEKVGSVTNTSRRVQVFSEAVPAPGIARPDWQILVELSQRWEASLPYSTPEQILADISANVPQYAGSHKLPSRYVDVGPEGFLALSAAGDAAE